MIVLPKDRRCISILNIMTSLDIFVLINIFCTFSLFNKAIALNTVLSYLGGPIGGLLIMAIWTEPKIEHLRSEVHLLRGYSEDVISVPTYVKEPRTT